MCGIVALSAADGRGWPLAAALEATQHRGPDDRGIFVSVGGDAGLGQNRLAIFDLSAAGHQPMWDHARRYCMVYNGETYNFQDLRGALEARHGPIAWRGHSDTEVVIEGFAREGFGFLDQLNGFFALAIYDSHTRELHVLRDPLGIKPLIATEQHGAVLFCSELKGLLALPGLRRTLRREALAEQLAFMYVPEPHTPYHEFYKVEPGVCHTWREGKLIARRPLFARLGPGEPRYRTMDEAVEALQGAFAAAVRRQVAADVPVSLFLSGGLDSSAVADHALRSGADIRDAYTIASSAADRGRDGQSDDLRYARLMAERLGISLNVIEARSDMLALLPELARFMEDGFSDPAAINTYLISAGARAQGVKVMLSGQGADEFLGGYRRYAAERALRRLPAPARSALAAMSRRLPGSAPGPLNAINRRLKRLGDLASQAPAERMLGMYTWTSPESLAALFVEPLSSLPGGQFADLASRVEADDCADTMMAIDRHYDLMSLNLCYTDRMSMAAGVEARVPFLDFDLVAVMNAIPARFKVRGSQGKQVFKKAMEPFLPRAVIYRSKAGFGLPIRAWMERSRDLLDHYLDPARLAAQGIYEPRAVAKLRHSQSAQADHANTLFTLLVQQIGLEAAGING